MSIGLDEAKRRLAVELEARQNRLEAPRQTGALRFRAMNGWLAQWFSAQEADRGGIIRRRRDYVEQYASMSSVVREAKKRGWHVVEVGDQIVVLCNEGDLRVLC